MNDHLLGIDWGTSNRRAYLVDREGRCLLRHADGQGMLATRGRFAESLGALLAALELGPETPVVMSGMVGSAQGWQQVDYLDPDVSLDALPRHLVPVAGARPAGSAAIVPGYCQRGARVDVMRGEETQLLGALALGQGDGWVVLPGTHSKWVRLAGGRIAEWSTYITGELFATLSTHGTLAPLVGSPDAQDDAAAFIEGLELARRAGPLTNTLFQVRARVVSGALDAASARSLASGLLIGAEFAATEAGSAASGAAGSLTLIGSPSLAAHYAVAARHFGRSLTVLDADRVYCAALSRFFQGSRP